MNRNDSDTPACMIAATASNSGKTTVSLGIMRALTRRGLNVQPFKSGPDYLDGTYHTRATGSPSYNLDAWMISESVLLNHFQSAISGNDIAVIEGAMGLYDGFEGTMEGSGAHLARLLGIPVILVIDCKGLSGSVAPVVHGFRTFRSDVPVAGVILNRTGSEHHVRYLKEALAACDIPVVGYLSRNEALTLPHRHLGLYTAAHDGITEDKIDAIADAVEKTIDLDILLQLCKPVRTPSLPPYTGRKPNCYSCRIAVAYDAAFHFYYQVNLDMLEQAGAEIVRFSPLTDTALPDNIDGIILGGGYPEEHTDTLSANSGMRQLIRVFSEAGGCIYAECGGFMFLGDSLEKDDTSYPMCGIFPAVFRMNDSKLTSLGYREITFTCDTILGQEGTVVRGHEFHYSRIKNITEQLPAPFLTTVKSSSARPEPAGMTVRNTLGSYLHLHFLSNPVIAQHFITSCAAKEPLH